MRVRITPSTVSGSIRIPSSKSMAHRAIICASLAKGTSRLTNIDFSDDIETTIAGMRKLGAEIEVCDHEVIVNGINSFHSLKEHEIFCNESGSTLRFFIPIFSLSDEKVSFTGRNRLLKRPQKVYEDLFHAHHLFYEQSDDAITIQGSLTPGTYELDGDVSSQFISGLLFALPLLNNDSFIKIRPPFESRSYVDLTLQMLKNFNIHAEFSDEHTIYIPGNQNYQANDIMVEGDYSQLAFFAVLAALNHDLTITGVDPNSLQGDKEIIDILKRCGCIMETIEYGYRVYKSDTKGIHINLENCPDLGPILTVLGMYSKDKTTIDHAQRLRLKESDRIEAMEEELHKFHVDISSTYDTITIHGNHSYQNSEILSAHKDHRIVMSLTVAALCSQSICEIDGAQAISKSYPQFFEDIQSIGGKVEILDDK